ncbi:MAG: 23S rRNA (pseudouridine(1915)-N(3))-methyltransferase RlmH [Bacteroidales bacterium]|nr:23S rRNA (pseudouridine(1915)-N(3))-methyltransferase RlmH [Bacteroidales bacterium]
MKITLLTIGKTDRKYIREGISVYEKRLSHYINFEIVEIPALKKVSSMPVEIIKQKESELLTRYLDKADSIILLDESGKALSSEEFAGFLQKKMNSGIREMVFVVGGAWGFHENLYKKANHTISLSKMTFSHQMIRLFFAEQIYRAFTILKGESYHNE